MDAGRKRLKTNESIHQQHLDARRSNIDKNTQLMIHTLSSVYYKNNTKYFYFLILHITTETLFKQKLYMFTIMTRFQDCGRVTLKVLQLMCCWCIKTDSCVSWLFGACCQTLSGFFSTWKSSHLSWIISFQRLWIKLLLWGFQALLSELFQRIQFIWNCSSFESSIHFFILTAAQTWFDMFE